jgi:hypothetical protein
MIMGKYLAISFMLVAFLMAVALPVSALLNSDDKFVLAGGNYFDPKIDCQTPLRCVLLAYDNSTDSINVYYTNNGFSSWNYTSQILNVGFGAFYQGYYDYYPLPFDVVYDVDGDQFRIITASYSAGVMKTKRYMFANGTFMADGSDIDKAGFWFYDSNRFLQLDVHDVYRSAAYHTDFFLYLTNFETGVQTQLVTATDVGRCSASSALSMVINFTEIAAAIGYTGSVQAYKFNITYTVAYANGTVVCTTNYTANTFSGFPDSSRDGMYFYNTQNGYYYYRNLTNVKRSSTTGFTSWSTPTSVYAFGAGEEIKHMSWKNFFSDDLIAYQYVNDTGIGVYVTNVSFTSPAYTPAAEYVNSTPVLYENAVKNLFGWHLYDPKVACETNNEHCAILFFDNSPSLLWGGGLWVYWSSKRPTYGVFEPVTSTYQDAAQFSTAYAQYWDDAAASTTAKPDYLGMPYDIMWAPSLGKYLIIVDNPTPLDGAEIWSYSPNDVPRFTYIRTLSKDDRPTGVTCADYGGCWRANYPIQFIDKESTVPRVAVLYQGCYSVDISGNCIHTTESIQYFYALNGTHIVTQSVVGDCSVGTSASFYRTVVRATLVDDAVYRYKIHAEGGTQGCGTRDYDNINTGFPTDYLGFAYIHDSGSNFKYTRAYSSSSVPEGIYSTSTSNFAAYSTSVLHYAYDKNIGEIIKLTDTEQTTGKNVFAYYRTSSGTPSQGIYFAKAELFPLYTTVQALDVSSGLYTNASTSATVIAADGYTEAGSGSSITLHTTKRSANTMKFLTTTYLPNYDETVFDVPTGCEFMFFFPKYLPASYNLALYVYDSVTGSPVSGATVQFNELLYTTGSAGNVTIPISPLADVVFAPVVDSGSCRITYNPSGSPRQYFVQISKTGYKSLVMMAESFAHAGGGTFTFDTTKTYSLDKGTAVTVSVVTNNYVPVEAGRVTVNVSGFSYIFPNVIATEFPYTWSVVNDTYPAILHLALALAGCTSTYNASGNLTIQSTDVAKAYQFKLPYNANQMPCVRDMDCAASYCVGNTYYALSGCNVGTCACDYSATVCGTLCDWDSGCYDLTSNVSCRFDSECYGNNRCADAYTIESWTCGFGGTCIAQYQECPTTCDSDENVCVGVAAVGVECDQSSVTGMLTCMQSGIMSFVGTTYNPMMTIGVVLFLVILIVAILGLGFRAVASVIR